MRVHPFSSATAIAFAASVATTAADGQQPNRVFGYRFADCEVRLLVDSLPGPPAPTWSPTGELFSLFNNDPERPELRIYSASGELRKRAAIPQSQGNGNEWSPDQRRIAYRGPLGAPDRSLVVTDVVTGESILTAPLEPLGHWPLVWSSDSRHVLLMRRPPDASDPRTSIERIDLDKKVQLLRRFAGNSGPVDDTTAYELRGRTYYIVNLNDPSKERQLITFDAGYVSSPAFSRDRQWVALRRNPSADNNRALTRLELMRRDGSGHVSIDLPFNAAPGEDNPQFLPNGREIIVTEDARFANAPGVYLVALEPRTVTRLLTASGRAGQQPQVSVSPDGRSLLYWSNEVKSNVTPLQPQSCNK